jgi:hypothetical protein
MEGVSVVTVARQVEKFISNVRPIYYIWGQSEKCVAPYYCNILLKVGERVRVSTSEEVCFLISKLRRKYLSGYEQHILILSSLLVVP